MKISKLIEELEHVRRGFGEIEVQMQDDPVSREQHLAGVAQIVTDPENQPHQFIGNPQAVLDLVKGPMSFQSFFIVPEQYEDGWICNLRTWPY
jgi:hypothetical protein